MLDFGKLALGEGDDAPAGEWRSRAPRRAGAQRFLAGTAEDADEDADRPVFSLVSGTYRTAKRYGAGAEAAAAVEEGASSAAVILRNQENALSVLPDSAASECRVFAVLVVLLICRVGEFLQSRTYQGLETRLGQDAPSVLEQGRSGIARGYQTDHR